MQVCRNYIFFPAFVDVGIFEDLQVLEFLNIFMRSDSLKNGDQDFGFLKNGDQDF